MKAEPAVQKSIEKPLTLLPKDDLFDRVQTINSSIAKRAFEIFETNGRSFGHETDHWLQAESEIVHPAHVELTESEGIFTVKAEVPGFTANDLDVSIEPTRLTILGRRETKEENKERQVLYRDRCLDQILRVVELPSEVNTGKVMVTIKDGLLELSMPKAAPEQREKPESRNASRRVETSPAFRRAEPH